MIDLRALAEAATPGPWHVGRPEAVSDGVFSETPTTYDTDDGLGYLVAWCHSDTKERADAAYIAACSPDRILALLDVVDAARAGLAAIEVEIRLHPYDADVPDSVIAARDSLRAALDRLP